MMMIMHSTGAGGLHLLRLVAIELYRKNGAADKGRIAMRRNEGRWFRCRWEVGVRGDAEWR